MDCLCSHSPGALETATLLWILMPLSLTKGDAASYIGGWLSLLYDVPPAPCADGWLIHCV